MHEDAAGLAFDGAAGGLAGLVAQATVGVVAGAMTLALVALVARLGRRRAIGAG